MVMVSMESGGAYELVHTMRGSQSGLWISNACLTCILSCIDSGEVHARLRLNLVGRFYL